MIATVVFRNDIKKFEWFEGVLLVLEHTLISELNSFRMSDIISNFYGRFMMFRNIKICWSCIPRTRNPGNHLKRLQKSKGESKLIVFIGKNSGFPQKKSHKSR